MKTKRKTPLAISSKVQQPFSSRSMDDLLAFLDGSQVEENDSFVCVVIHNMDGPGLRDSESQQYLARIASCLHIRIIASIDNVNAPLCKFILANVCYPWIVCWLHVVCCLSIILFLMLVKSCH